MTKTATCLFNQLFAITKYGKDVRTEEATDEAEVNANDKPVKTNIQGRIQMELTKGSRKISSRERVLDDRANYRQD